MKKYVLVLALMLSGCATTQQVLSEKPQEVHKSAKSAETVALCIANANGISPTKREDGSYLLLIKNGYGATGMTFTVIPDGSGSILEIRKPISLSIAKWTRCLSEA